MYDWACYTFRYMFLSDNIEKNEKYFPLDLNDLKVDGIVDIHCGIAHTRWATHGCPNELNSHPHRSDITHSFLVVHNGIITNFKEMKTFLHNKGYEFESETDTEVIAKLIHHFYKQRSFCSFRELVENVIAQLVFVIFNYLSSEILNVIFRGQTLAITYS